MPDDDCTNLPVTEPTPASVPLLGDGGAATHSAIEAAKTAGRRPSLPLLLALLTLAALTTLSLTLPPQSSPVAARPIAVSTVPSPHLPDGGGPQAAAALNRPLTITIGAESRTLSAAALADLGGASLERGGVPSLRIGPDELAELLGPALLASLNREARSARYAVDADAGDGIQGVLPDESARTFDLTAAATVLSRTLNRLVAGRLATRTIALPLRETPAALQAQTLTAALPQLTLLGSQTIRYLPALSNAYGVNILVPGRVFAGQVIAPGDWFDFWKQIGPVTRAAGYRQGGAFLGGIVVADGAFAGGICATATALYAAAVRAGLPIGARSPHYSYLPAYPLGLDATVWQEGKRETTMRFQNDTTGPLVIVVRQSRGYLRVELFGITDGRQVELVTGSFTNVRYGSGGRAGGAVTVIRTIRNGDGSLRSTERIRSVYAPS